MNQSDKYQIFIKTDTLTYEEYYYFNPFQISIKKNGLILSVEVGEIEFYDDLEVNKLWQAKQSYNSTDIKILQNNQILFESKFSLYNLPFDLATHSAKIKPIPQATDANELLKKYDKEVDLLRGTKVSATYSETPLTEKLYVTNLPASFFTVFGYADAGTPTGVNWNPGTAYKATVGFFNDDGDEIVTFDELINAGAACAYADNFVYYATTGKHYYCILDHTNIPPDDPSGGTYWAVAGNPTETIVKQYNRTLRRSYKTGYDVITILSDTATCLSYVTGAEAGVSYFVDGIIDAAVQNFTFDDLRKLSTIFDITIREVFSGAGIQFSNTLGANCWANYLLNSTEYNNLHLYHISDIKRPAGTPPAKFYKIKFSDFLKDMKLMFGLDWLINDSNYFQFIHPSERTTPTTIKDFTSVSKNNQIPKNKSSNVISKETFSYRSSGNVNFDEAQLLYDSDGDVIGYSLDRVCNNFLACTNDNDMIDDIGYGMFNLDGSDLIQNNNEDMNATNLVINNLLYARPNNSGTINGVVKALNTSEQVELDTINAELNMNINEITIDLGFITALTRKIGADYKATFSEIIYRTDSNLQEIKLLNI